MNILTFLITCNNNICCILISELSRVCTSHLSVRMKMQFLHELAFSFLFDLQFTYSIPTFIIKTLLFFCLVLLLLFTHFDMLKDNACQQTNKQTIIDILLTNCLLIRLFTSFLPVFLLVN